MKGVKIFWWREKNGKWKLWLWLRGSHASLYLFSLSLSPQFFCKTFKWFSWLGVALFIVLFYFCFQGCNLNSKIFLKCVLYVYAHFGFCFVLLVVVTIRCWREREREKKEAASRLDVFQNFFLKVITSAFVIVNFFSHKFVCCWCLFIYCLASFLFSILILFSLSFSFLIQIKI